MKKREVKGIADLPIVIILGVLMACITAGLGFSAVERVERVKRKQEAIQSFNRLVETCRNLNYGVLGEKQKLKLSLNSSKIRIFERLAKLKNEKETIKVRRLPLPLIHKGEDNFLLHSGDFQVELVEINSNNENKVKLALKFSEI